MNHLRGGDQIKPTQMEKALFITGLKYHSRFRRRHPLSPSIIPTLWASVVFLGINDDKNPEEVQSYRLLAAATTFSAVIPYSL
jgi:hypothetical protein